MDIKNDLQDLIKISQKGENWAFLYRSMRVAACFYLPKKLHKYKKIKRKYHIFNLGLLTITYFSLSYTQNWK